jgi:hypothetical protein
VRTEIVTSAGGVRTLDERAAGWNRVRAGARSLNATSTDLELRRTITADATALAVRDVLVNRSSGDLGLRVRHALPRSDAAAEFLGGTSLPAQPIAVAQSVPSAPTAVVTRAGVSVGLLPANDRFWVHAETDRDATTLGLRDAQSVIARGDSAVLEWRVVAVAGDHDAWLAAARSTLGADFPLDGGFGFGSFAMIDWPVEKLREWIRIRGLRFVASPAPTQSGGHGLHGTALLDAADAREKMRRFASAVHAASPDVRVLAYFHAFLCNRAGADQRYAKERVTDRNGTHLYYPSRERPREFGLYVPVVGSPFARDLDALVDQLLALGFDGLYWDEMAYSVTPFTYSEPWDGASADLAEPKLAVVRRKSSVALLAQPWTDALLARLERAGKHVVANTQPVTHSALRHRFPRFVEDIDGTAAGAARLWSPIGLGDRSRERDAADVASRIRAHLERGLLYYYYSPVVTIAEPNLTAFMFPATPRRIAPGVFIAEERILVSRSGTYGWGDLSGHEVHVFDAEGRERKHSAATAADAQERRTQISLSAGETAVIVRRPVP